MPDHRVYRLLLCARRESTGVERRIDVPAALVLASVGARLGESFGYPPQETGFLALDVDLDAQEHCDRAFQQTLRLGDAAMRPGDRLTWYAEGDLHTVTVLDGRYGDDALVRAEGLPPDRCLLRPLPAVDEVAGGVFARLAAMAQICPCGCGRLFDRSREQTLRSGPALDVADLARQAVLSPLAQGALALAQWAGDGRPGHALAAPGAADGDPVQVAAIWSAARAARVIEVDDDRVTRGPGAAILLGGPESGPGPVAQLETWVALLAGYWRGAVEAALASQDPVRLRAAELAGLTVMLLHAQDEQPLAAWVVSLAMHVPTVQVAPSDLAVDVQAVRWLTERWAAIGAADLCAPAEHQATLTELSRRLRAGTAGDATGAYCTEHQAVLNDLADQVESDPVVSLTALGRYACARLLTGHGFILHELGSLLELPAESLLDRLPLLTLVDAVEELRQWLEARSADPHRAVRSLLRAATGAARERPGRRTTLTALLPTLDPRLDAVLDEYADDTWLGALARITRAGSGPDGMSDDPDVLWLMVDRAAGRPRHPGDDSPDLAMRHLAGLLCHDEFAPLVLQVEHPLRNTVLAELWKLLPPGDRALLAPGMARTVRRIATDVKRARKRPGSPRQRAERTVG